MALFYLVNRVRPNGREDEITRVSTIGMSEEQIQTLRETSLAQARAAKNLNGWRVVVYGPNETENPHTPDDKVWDSAIDL